MILLIKKKKSEDSTADSKNSLVKNISGYSLKLKHVACKTVTLA
jgi:hypothetical protein